MARVVRVAHTVLVRTRPDTTLRSVRAARAPGNGLIVRVEPGGLTVLRLRGSLLTMVVRRVAESDVDAVVALVHELAGYERASEQCRLTGAQLYAALFGAQPALFGHVADNSGEVAGVALWFLNFSTWDGVHGIYVEDLFVRSVHRGAGLGRELLAALAAECVRQGYSRLQWSVLDWNVPAIGFYRRLGAAPMDDWTVYRIDGTALVTLARGSGDRDWFPDQ